MTIVEIQARIKARVLDIRNLEYFIMTDKFERAFKMANKTDKESMCRAIDSGSINVLKNMSNKILRGCIHDKSLKDLREIASQRGLAHFNSYNKNDLLTILIKETQT